MFAFAVAVVGCTDDSGLNDEERALLDTMVLDSTTPIPASPTNRVADDTAAAELGQALFFDKRFMTGALNCRGCHDLTSGGADTRTRGPTTLNGTTALSRNTPTVFNIAFVPGINHWSGNFTAIWSVPHDVGSSTLGMAHYMYNDPYYRPAYEALFGPMPALDDLARFPATGNYRSMDWAKMTPDDQKAMGRLGTNLGKSLEAYQRLLIDRNSPFDRYMSGEETAMSTAAIRGAKLFVGRAGCNECHNGPTFSDFQFHNIGVPQAATAPKKDYGFIGAAAFQSTYPYNANSEFSDDPAYGAALVANLMQVTTEELPTVCGSDPLPGCGAFKTARLRSVALTGPYFHTGDFDSLWDVVSFYNEAAGSDNYVGKRSAAIRPLYLSDDDMTDLVEFLTSLTGEPIAEQWAKCPTGRIPADACFAP
jgi:cytochrome c peroxidase